MNPDGDVPAAWGGFDAVDAVRRIEFIPTVLRLIQEHTGMGWSGVARVTEDSWTACAVNDSIGLGLAPGDPLDVETTLCIEVRRGNQPVAISHASQDAVYASHACPKMYRFESYVSVPIVLPGGEYFGNLCGLDPNPHPVSDARTLAMFEAYASLIACYVEVERQRDAAQAALMLRMRGGETKSVPR